MMATSEVAQMWFYVGMAEFSKQFGINCRWTYKTISNQDDKKQFGFCYFIIKNDLFIEIIKFTGVMTDYCGWNWSRQLNYIIENWPKMIIAGKPKFMEIIYTKWLILLYCYNNIILLEITVDLVWKAREEKIWLWYYYNNIILIETTMAVTARGFTIVRNEGCCLKWPKGYIIQEWRSYAKQIERIWLLGLWSHIQHWCCAKQGWNPRFVEPRHSHNRLLVYHDRIKSILLKNSHLSDWMTIMRSGWHGGYIYKMTGIFIW